LDIAWLVPRFKEITEKEGCVFIDTYSELLPIWDQLSVDGIHLTPKGQKMIAKLIKKHY
jgi:lysophospholipase L1-like esterase